MRMLRIKAVLDRTGLPERSLYTMISEGKFPRPVQLSARAVGWPDSEVDDWIQSKIAARDAQAAA
jgi:prophage regulatory protein